MIFTNYKLSKKTKVKITLTRVRLPLTIYGSSGKFQSSCKRKGALEVELFQSSKKCRKRHAIKRGKHDGIGHRFLPKSKTSFLFSCFRVESFPYVAFHFLMQSMQILRMLPPPPRAPQRQIVTVWAPYQLNN
jgi:hypothetical protein